ncbi:MAG TPA: ABC transporter permease [Thermoanaerobaculia bacterium]|nr:ABC transporter permease [Thermoanaerobaculia bacterium]
MVLDENIRVAFTALRANLMRSVLTALGIIIGVAAVIAVVSIVQGLQHMITGQLENVGATFIQVVPKQEFGGPGMVQHQVRLTWEDGQAILQHVRNVGLITPQIFGQTEVKYRDRQHKPFVLGVNSDWPDVNKFNVDRGRFFSRLDLERRAKVAVVGTSVVDDLKVREPIGAEIYVGNTPVTIIGVMEKKGRALGFDYDDMVFVPFDSALNIFGRRAADQVQLQLQATTSESVDQVKDDIKRLLRERHHIVGETPDDFQVMVQNELISIYSKILGGVTAVVGAIVGVALLVGGIGIMNIMLVSVTERTREIGIRKSVGARRKDILVQFLIEAVTLALIGGVIGIALGYGAGVLAVKLIPGDFPAAHVPLWAVAIAFGFCSLVGIVFGIYPASKAAKLDPIEALRYE